MGYKPGDFFVNVIDFFGVLVPGAVLLFLDGRYFIRALGLDLGCSDGVRWAVFLVGSFVLGQFLLGMGVRLNGLLHFYCPEREDKYYQEVKEHVTLPANIKDRRRACFLRVYTILRIKNSPALAEVDRQMADFKLFRSLLFVFAIDFLISLAKGLGKERVLFSGILFLLAGWRFLFLISWTYRTAFEAYAVTMVKEPPTMADCAEQE